jgi:hypothetical protein
LDYSEDGEMTDKDEMRKEFERWYEAKQMPAESNWFKKYGEENASNEYWYSDTQDAWEIWQAAVESSSKELSELQTAYNDLLARSVGRLNTLEVRERELAELEKKLADQQEQLKTLAIYKEDDHAWVVRHSAASQTEIDARTKKCVVACINLSDGQLQYAYEARCEGLFAFKKRHEEELTKREAAAKQAGRDEVMKELSEMEPVAWKFEEAVPK